MKPTSKNHKGEEFLLSTLALIITDRNGKSKYKAMKRSITYELQL